MIPIKQRNGLSISDLPTRAAEVDREKLDLSGAASPYRCFSAKNCGGKVISGRDRHNCKVKSRGKSWCDTRDGICYNI